MKLSTRDYVAFDSNIWIGLPKTIERYAQLRDEARPRILCQQQCFVDGVSSRDDLTVAVAFINRALSIPEGWCKRSDEVLRAVLSYIEFDWEGAPEIRLDNAGEQRWLNGIRRAQSVIGEKHQIFVHSQKKMRTSRQRTIPDNQAVFEKLRERAHLTMSSQAVKEAWDGLLAVSVLPRPCLLRHSKHETTCPGDKEARIWRNGNSGSST